jgi:superfamily II DNA/RNA helicase
VERGEVDILLGTQMIAKGLDFPNVTLVGVINADVGINLPDFRATERTFQLLTQVAGRAGRGSKGGEVVVQTSLPTHYAVTCAAEHDFLAFAERELAERREPRLPASYAARQLVFSGLEEEATRQLALRAERVAHRAPRARGRRRSGDHRARALSDRPHPDPLALASAAPLGEWRQPRHGRRYFAERFRVPGGRLELRVRWIGTLSRCCERGEGGTGFGHRCLAEARDYRGRGGGSVAGEGIPGLL